LKNEEPSSRLYRLNLIEYSIARER